MGTLGPFNGIPPRPRTTKQEHRELMEPFYARFPTLTGPQRGVFFVAFMAVGVAAVMLMAPSTYHRIMWRQEDPERLIRTANRLLIAASALLAVAIVAVVFLTADLLFGAAAAVAFAAVVAATLSWTWFVLPMWRLNGGSPYVASDDDDEDVLDDDRSSVADDTASSLPRSRVG
jgi:heme A synthase